MSQPWPNNQGATPVPEKSSRSKQDGRRHNKRIESDLTTGQTISPGRPPHTTASVQRRDSAGLLERPSINQTNERSRNGSAVSPYAYRAVGSTDSTSFASPYSPPSSVGYSPSAYAPLVAHSSQQAQSYAPVVASTTRGKSNAKVDEAVIPYSYTDPKSGIKTAVIEGPPSKITAAEFQQQGIFAQKSIVESRKVIKGSATGSKEKSILPPAEYEVKPKGKGSFKFGNVIELLYVPPRSGDTTLTHFSRDIGLSRVRRFVVIREGQGNSMLLPISTYGGRGVADPELVKSHHCIIYTTAEAPPLLPGEGPTRISGGVDFLRQPPIKVIPADRTRKLDEKSRLNLARIYQIDHAGCEINVFGAVEGEHLRHLMYHFNAVQRSLPPSERLQTIQYDELEHRRQGGGQAYGQPGTLHGRVDSVQQALSPEAPKDPAEQEHNRHDNRALQTRDELEASSSMANLAQQMAALNVRAQSAGLDLDRLTDHQRNYLARMPLAEQRQRILELVPRQDPQRYAELQARYQRARAASAQAAQDSAEDDDDDDDEDDDDDDEDEEESSEESSEEE